MIDAGKRPRRFPRHRHGHGRAFLRADFKRRLALRRRVRNERDFNKALKFAQFGEPRFPFRQARRGLREGRGWVARDVHVHLPDAHVARRVADFEQQRMPPFRDARRIPHAAVFRKHLTIGEMRGRQVVEPVIIMRRIAQARQVIIIDQPAAMVRVVCHLIELIMKKSRFVNGKINLIHAACRDVEVNFIHRAAILRADLIERRRREAHLAEHFWNLPIDKAIRLFLQGKFLKMVFAVDERFRAQRLD